LQPAGLVVLDRGRHCFGERCHEEYCDYTACKPTAAIGVARGAGF